MGRAVLCRRAYPTLERFLRDNGEVPRRQNKRQFCKLCDCLHELSSSIIPLQGNLYLHLCRASPPNNPTIANMAQPYTVKWYYCLSSLSLSVANGESSGASWRREEWRWVSPLISNLDRFVTEILMILQPSSRISSPTQRFGALMTLRTKSLPLPRPVPRRVQSTS